MLELYKSCYNLEGEPFRLGPDHRFSFAHRSYANARAYLEYALSQGEGFIAITGGVGTGKTTLINDLLEEIDRSRTLVATLTSAQLDLDHLIMLVISSFGLQVKGDSIALSLIELDQFLAQRNSSGGSAILVVDEAQGLSPDSLEELRLLSNLQRGGQLLLQIFLVGQDGLLEMIRAPGMENLHQRLIATACLESLDLDETVSYLEYRLCQVGWQGDPAISEEAIRVIHTFSGGIPRRINLIAHRLFLYGGMHQKHALTGEDARQVIEELRMECLLAAEVAILEYPGDDLSVESGDSDNLSRALPRAESFALAKLHSQQSVASVSGEFATDIASPWDPVGLAEGQESEYPASAADPQTSESGVFSGSASETYAECDKQFSDSAAVRDKIASVGRLMSELNRHRVPATVLFLLAGLLLTAFVEKDFRNQLISFMHVVLNKADHNTVGIPASLPKNLDAPYDFDSTVSPQSGINTSL